MHIVEDQFLFERHLVEGKLNKSWIHIRSTVPCTFDASLKEVGTHIGDALIGLMGDDHSGGIIYHSTLTLRLLANESFDSQLARLIPSFKKYLDYMYGDPKDGTNRAALIWYEDNFYAIGRSATHMEVRDITDTFS